MQFSMLYAALLSLLVSGPLAAQIFPEPPQPGEKIFDVAERYEAHFAKVGTAKGSGFSQYSRWFDFVAARTMPTGEFVNFTALNFLRHNEEVRSEELREARAAATAAGIGTGNWRPVGPARAALAAEGGDIGRINAIAFDARRPGTLYAATPASGLWMSPDDGKTWKSLTDGLGLIGVQDIAVDPQSPDTIYIMTGDAEMRTSPSMGMMKSTDGGKKWLNTGFIWKANEGPFYGYRLAIHPANPSILLAGTNFGLVKITDGGKTWKLQIKGAVFYDVLFHPANASIVYAASHNAVYRSSDSGETWTQLTQGLPNNPGSDRIRLAVTHASPNTLYVLYGAPDGFSVGLYRSDDGGNTFARRSSSVQKPKDPYGTPPPLDSSRPNILGRAENDFQSQSWYDLTMAVSPSNVDHVHVGGVDTWRSDDGGRTWKRTSKWDHDYQRDYVHADIHALEFRGNTLYVGSDGGIFRTTDRGETWANITNVSTGIGIAQIYHICVTPQDPNLVYFGAQDNGSWRLLADGQTKKVKGGDGFVCQINPRDSQIVYASSQYGTIYRSDDGGQKRWEWITPRAGNTTVPGPWLTPFVAPNDPSTVYACYTDLWRAMPTPAAPGAALPPGTPSVQWMNLSNGALGASINCRQVAVAASAPNTIYIAKSGGIGPGMRTFDPKGLTPFLGGGGVYRSQDGGRSWESITATLPINKAMISNLAVSPTDARRVWVTFGSYDPQSKVFESKDGGTSWTNISAGLPNVPVNTVVAQNVATHGVFIGTDSGVYYRDDNLGRWVPFKDNLPGVIISSLQIDDARGRLFAGTFGRGVWQSDIPTSATKPTRTLQARTRLEPAPPISPEPSYAGPLDVFE